MLEDLSKEVKAQLYDRAKSPLFGGFAFAWLGWNFRAVLVIISDLKYQEKMAIWDTLYPTAESWLRQAALYPFISAVVFILAYPYPARWIFEYWYTQHSKLKRVQQTIEDKTPLTQEEAKELRRSTVEQQVIAQKQINDLAAQNRVLSEEKKLLLAQSADIQTAVDDFRTQLAAANEQLVKLKAGGQDIESSVPPDVSVATPKEILPDGSSNVSPSFDSMLSILTEDTRSEIASRAPVLSNRKILGVFLAFIASGGRYVSPHKISSRFNANRVDVDHGIWRLENEGLIEFVEGSDAFSLTPSGRDIAIDLDLTDRLPVVLL